MRTAYSKSSSSFIPSYSENAVLQLIAALGVGYIAYFFVAVCFQAFGQYSFEDAVALIRPNIALSPTKLYLIKWWTILTYGLSHDGFWDWLSNMVWLYCFGNILQSLIGYRQIFPLFLGGLLVGGLFYLLGQALPVAFLKTNVAALGAQAGIMAFAVACLTVSPKYRMYLGPTFSIPIVVVFCIFTVLMLLRINTVPAKAFLLLGGAAAGFGYVKLLQAGRQPGEWLYGMVDRVESSFMPKKPQQTLYHNGVISQGIIDDILDKISSHGYKSLSMEERDILMRAGQENK